MSAKQYFDFEYDNKHIESVVKESDLVSLYDLMDEYTMNIAIQYGIWYKEKKDDCLTLTDKEYFRWFKEDELNTF